MAEPWQRMVEDDDDDSPFADTFHPDRLRAVELQCLTARYIANVVLGVAVIWIVVNAFSHRTP